MSNPVEGKSLVVDLDLELCPTHCGYCGGFGSLSQGLVFDVLSVNDYQEMIDRGWRRSGRYVYKPVMDKTCCPQYTIRCNVNQFQPTKSQRKVIKKVQNYISKKDADVSPSQETRKNRPSKEKKDSNSLKQKSNEERKDAEIGKAKHFRKQKYLQKLIDIGHVIDSSKLILNNTPKTLDELVQNRGKFSLNTKILQSETESKHKFELRLVKADLSDDNFMSSLRESFTVYQKYQMAVHHDSKNDCDIQTYAGFLCDSPLVYESTDKLMYGSFHQQYLVDDAIVCVAVLDILPHCVSSVYLYYDPDWWGQNSRVSPGTYSALREIQLSKDLDLPYYYMGYYIHSVPKMRYKGRFQPSDLLCPQHLSWHDINQCTPVLDQTKFATFENLPAVQDSAVEAKVDKNEVHLLVENKLINYQDYLYMRPNQLNEVDEYMKLIGPSLSKKLILQM